MIAAGARHQRVSYLLVFPAKAGIHERHNRAII